MMDQKEILEDYWLAETAKTGIQIGGELRQLFHYAADRAVDEGYNLLPEVQAQADNNFRVLIEAIVKFSRRVGDSDLWETSLPTVLSSLCPIWPFC